jgi:hypothetical protein
MTAEEARAFGTTIEQATSITIFLGMVIRARDEIMTSGSVTTITLGP